MAGVLRRLVTEVVLKSADAVKGLKVYDRLWKATAKSVEASATAIEKAADRAGAAMARMSEGAAAVRAGVGGLGGGRGGGSGGGGPRRARTEDAEINRIAREGQKAAAKSSQSSAMQAGFRQGAAAVASATQALGKFATASERARAKVADLDAQVQRNRKDLADLRAEALKTGDADGTLAAKMRGLSVATGQANSELQKARRELRAVDGSLIDAVKSATNLSGRFDAMRVAAGNLISAGITRAVQGVGAGLVGAAKSAIDFKSSMADVKKVLSAPDLKNFDVLNQGVLDLAKNIGIAPTEVAALTASLAQSGIAGDELLKTAEDASKLAVAFGISGEQSGQALAKLRTGLGLSRDEVNSLTGTINELSNNLAATAPEITDAVQRVGAVGKAANLSGQTVAALATSMIASGAGADVAATGTKNFIRALGSGAAATKKQREAFAALGLSAEETALQMTRGGKESEAAIAEVVKRIGMLRQEERLPVLIELFGSESIGAIGPLATNIDLLTRSFELAGDAASAAGSVEKEFAARSSTTDQAIKKLKASVEVLAIEFGNQLLPYINDVVKFLTSPEGQDWGREAVSKAVTVVTGLADGVKSLGEFFSFLIDKIGGTGVAVAALGVVIAGLTGPLGLVAAAGLAMGAALAEGIDRVVHSAERGQLALLQLHNKAQALRNQEAQAEVAGVQGELDAGNAETARQQRVQAATDKWERQERAKSGGNLTSEQSLAITRRAARMREELHAGKYSTGSFEDRVSAFEASLTPSNETGVTGLAGAKAASHSGKVDLSGYDQEQKEQLFDNLVSRRKSLKPSERKMLLALSKDLDRRIPTGAGHKQTKMDKQLAALSPELRGLLTQGGDEDKGGDLKVHDDILSRGAFGAATTRKGLGGVDSGSGGVGPGPNINNTYINTTITVAQSIDARSSAPVPDNIRNAADASGRQAGGVVFTGVQRALGLKNSGARMA